MRLSAPINGAAIEFATFQNSIVARSIDLFRSNESDKKVAAKPKN